MRREFLIKLVILSILGLVVYQFGLKPIFNNELFEKHDKKITWAKGKLVSEQDKYDVIVYGEEPAGIAAAVSAARIGARTLLIAQDEQLGGFITRTLASDLDINKNPKGEFLNRGIASELYNQLGGDFASAKYADSVEKLIAMEKNIDVLRSAQITGAVVTDGVLTGIEVSAGDNKSVYNGKRFIDASRDGDMLVKCNVPYFSGSADLNKPDSFMPVRLNFKISGVNWQEVKGLLNSTNSGEFYSIIKKYEPLHANIRINAFNLIEQEDGSAAVQGIEVYNVKADDGKAVANAYREAAEEAENLTAYLKSVFMVFKDIKYEGAAEELYIPENRHFLGEYVLKVNDILENRNFSDRIATASAPVDASKLGNGNTRYIVGKPMNYSLPLGCIIPLNVDNVLMVGSKASYSSLAASSAGSLGPSISEGESAGVVAVYSLIKDITPREILKGKDGLKLKELQSYLKRQGVYIPDFKTENKNASEWAYPSLRQLISVGLVSGGMENDFRFKEQAVQKDLAGILLNGVVRLDRDKYSLELDLRLRPFDASEPLTKERAAEMLLAFHNAGAGGQGAYEKACQAGYINDEMQKKLKSENGLTMEDVYYLGAYNLQRFTGKSFPE